MKNEENFMALDEKIAELLSQKFHCSQIMMQIGLDALDLDEPNLVKAMTGLAGGLGGCGKNCGALTGGVCMISLFAGRGAAEGEAGPEFETMVSEFLLWFEETYGSADCGDIIQGDKDNISSTCPQLICATCRKALELLQSYGFPVEKVLE
jgi:C_GCAxxG_C_C family probable redox protein